MTDEARVADLRARWTRITPQPHLGPGGQTGWQLAQPDVLYLLDLAEESLRLREDRDHLLGVLTVVRAEDEQRRETLARLVAVAGELSYHQAGPHWDALCAALAEARAVR